MSESSLISHGIVSKHYYLSTGQSRKYQLVHMHHSFIRHNVASRLTSMYSKPSRLPGRYRILDLGATTKIIKYSQTLRVHLDSCKAAIFTSMKLQRILWDCTGMSIGSIAYMSSTGINVIDSLRFNVLKCMITATNTIQKERSSNIRHKLLKNVRK